MTPGDPSETDPQQRPTQPPQAAADPFEGRTLLDKYLMKAPLARGGMGRVYEAEQLPLGRTVAVKVLAIRGGVDADERFHARFFREAQACSRLAHPNTVVLHDYGCTDSGDYFLVMERLVGHTLQETLTTDGPFDAATAIQLGLGIAGALSEAHSAGLVHRDLKPSNVFIADCGGATVAKVIDFGLVKRLGKSDDTLTQEGSMLGSPRYMAPEQVIGLHIDHRADIYALGALLFRVLTGRVLFEAPSSFAIMNAHVNKPAPRVTDVCAECVVSSELQDVIGKCIAKDKADRFETMTEVADALAACPEAPAGPFALRPAPWGAPDGVEAPRSEPEPSNDEHTKGLAPPMPAKPRSMRAWAAAFVILGVGGVAWWVSHEPPAEAEVPADASQVTNAVETRVEPAAPSPAPARAHGTDGVDERSAIEATVPAAPPSTSARARRPASRPTTPNPQAAPEEERPSAPEPSSVPSAHEPRPPWQPSTSDNRDPWERP